MNEIELDVLHSLDGDRKKKLSTSTPELREVAAETFEKLLRQGTAIFLERGKKTYRVKAYDAKSDRLKVVVERRGRLATVGASPQKGVKTAVPPRAGG